MALAFPDYCLWRLGHLVACGPTDHLSGEELLQTQQALLLGVGCPAEVTVWKAPIIRACNFVRCWQT